MEPFNKFKKAPVLPVGRVHTQNTIRKRSGTRQNTAMLWIAAGAVKKSLDKIRGIREGIVDRFHQARHNTKAERDAGEKHADHITNKVADVVSTVSSKAGKFVKSTGTIAKHAAHAYVVHQEMKRLKDKKLI